MISKVYRINGFDCANCAQTVEDYLNKSPSIASAKIDFAGNRLFLTFSNQELSHDEILSLIGEVETDVITLSDVHQKPNPVKLLTKKDIVTLFRAVTGLIFVVLSLTVFKALPWVNFACSLFAVVLLTYDVIWKVIKHIFHKENPLDEFLLITLSTYGAFIIAALPASVGGTGDYEEAIMVVLLFQIGEIIESVATNKSRQAISSAVDLRIDKANVLKEDELIKMSPEKVEIGDMVVAVNGEQIPVDGTVQSGEATLDTSFLSGETKPILVKAGNKVFAGSFIQSGSLHIATEKRYEDSLLRKMAGLVNGSEIKKSHSDRFITRFARWYTPIVFLAGVAFALIGGAVTGAWSQYILNGLKMLVVACPCALVISIPLAYFSGVGLASKNGIVVKGSGYLEELLKMKKLVIGRTEMITHGSLAISQIKPNEVKKEELLEVLYAGACLSESPLAKAICHQRNLKHLAAEITAYDETPGLGVSCQRKNDAILIGQKSFFTTRGLPLPEVKENGIAIYVYQNDVYLGYVVLTDQTYCKATPLVEQLHDNNIELVLLSEKDQKSAEESCRQLQIDRYQAGLLPDEKRLALDREMPSFRRYSVGYLGDSVNDIDSIRKSDIGIAMGGTASDIVVNAADIIIMNDDPAKVSEAIQIARMAHHVALFNLIFALVIKFSLELAIILTTMTVGDVIPMFAAVIADTGLTVLLILHSLLLLYRKVRRKKVS